MEVSMASVVDHRRRRRSALGIAALRSAAVAVALWAVTAGLATTPDLLDTVLSEVRPLRELVESGQIVPKFGEKSEGIMEAIRARSAGPEIERAVDGMLHALFLQQLALLRQQLAAKHEKSGPDAKVVAQADRQFVTLSSELKRPGADWSFDQERYALRAFLEGTFRREAAIVGEQSNAAQTQQSTIKVIGKLQSQMEALQQRVQSMRAGSPWFLSTSYRIPKTPLTLIGRYQQGRANIELILSQDKDPINAETGFVEGIGPANVGVNLNVGA